VLNGGEDEPADFGEQPPVVPEIRPQEFRDREDEPPLRQPQEELLVHVLSQKQGALLGAGRAEVEGLAAERKKVFRPAVGVTALDASDTLAIVAAGEEPLHRPADPLEAELPALFGELGLVAGEELGEVGTEEPLDRAFPPLAVGARERAACSDPCLRRREALVTRRVSPHQYDASGKSAGEKRDTIRRSGTGDTGKVCLTGSNQRLIRIGTSAFALPHHRDQPGLADRGVASNELRAKLDSGGDEDTVERVAVR